MALQLFHQHHIDWTEHAKNRRIWVILPNIDCETPLLCYISDLLMNLNLFSLHFCR